MAISIDPKAIPSVVNRFGFTTLAQNLLATDASITIGDASSLPDGDEGGCIQINDEIIIFESRQGNTLINCRRGQDNSQPVDHNLGDLVTSKIVAVNFNAMKSAILDIQNELTNSYKQQEVIEITSLMLQQEYIDLEAEPASQDSIELTPAGGPMQVIDVDFEVTGNRLSWKNLGLSGFLEIGDKIIILYDI